MSFLDSLLDGIGDAADEVGAAWSRGFFDVTQSAFDLLGFRTAADNLRRYRSGVGGDYTYSAEEMAGHPAYDDSIDINRSRFESTTFTGRTRDDSINKGLLELGDGQNFQFSDHYDHDIAYSRPSTYLAFGRSGVHSTGGFDAQRAGDRLLVQGRVTNRLGSRKDDFETFDFNEGQPGHYEGTTLERRGQARPFNMRYSQEQDVNAELRYVPDPRNPSRSILTLVRSTWGPIR
ncbi:hypothetical protein HL658_20670 [Azospirillum sp. RWY-5-1]|uniref:Uncharacterized protein n=1 Tax=Azospirillum oleiclasticum TaxID=2735135 RepID=A0ABX2TI35_9PROT|nr:hypothetical protein [Azospirillum oleiclasticum]NYZ14967.1 hypothetical protein [Azospirillum oleiclasticum]NYZ22729.1 hypothetical protein [Azospirillum oleiclasticum]